MSKLGCKCGSTIYDQSDCLPFKGSIIRDQDSDELYDNLASDIAAFIDSIIRSKRDNWIQNYFSSGYPSNLDNTEIIQDILSNHLIHKSLTAYQCEQCGRVYIQADLALNAFYSFKPDEELEGKGIGILRIKDEGKR